MALEAGRVGVRTDQVDPYGRIKVSGDIAVDNLTVSGELEFGEDGDFGENAKAKINDAVEINPIFDELATDDILSKTQVGGSSVEFASFNSVDSHWHVANTKVDDALLIDGELELGDTGYLGEDLQSAIISTTELSSNIFMIRSSLGISDVFDIRDNGYYLMTSSNVRNLPTSGYHHVLVFGGDSYRIVFAIRHKIDSASSNLDLYMNKKYADTGWYGWKKVSFSAVSLLDKVKMFLFPNKDED